MNKPLRLTIPFWVSPDGVLEDGLSLTYEPASLKSSVVSSGLCLTDSEGNPGEIFATLGFVDGREIPRKQKISRCSCENNNSIKYLRPGCPCLYQHHNQQCMLINISSIQSIRSSYFLSL